MSRSRAPTHPSIGVEILVSNIPYSVEESDVISSLAKVLHDAPFHVRGSALMNFKFSLWMRGRSSCGKGSLTIPDTYIGEQFLLRYGYSQNQRYAVLRIDIGGRRLRFEKGSNRPIPQLVQILRTTPFEDPRVMEAEHRLTEELGRSVEIDTISFGAICRDSVFSPEHSETATGGTVKFDSHRSLIIQEYRPRGIATIVIGISNIKTVWIDKDVVPPAVLLDCRYPASFYMIEGNTRTRITAFSSEHSRVAPYCSRTIGLTFKAKEDLYTFQFRAGKVRSFPHPVTTLLPVANRELYCVKRLERFSRWASNRPLEVALQCELAVRNLLLDPIEMMSLAVSIQRLEREAKGEKRASKVVRLLVQQLSTSPIPWTNLSEAKAGLKQKLKEAIRKADMDITPRSLDDNADFFQCHHFYVKPTTIELEGPVSDQSNRILRLYPNHHHHFARISFCEEDGARLRYDSDSNFIEFVKQRVGDVLKNGIEIAGVRFDWLGYSSSALRDHQAWFVAPFKLGSRVISASKIRDEMGDFSRTIDQPAKYGARMSQAFTATNATITIEEEAIERNVPDIEANDHCFTDGVGEISFELAQDIWSNFQQNRRRKKAPEKVPSAFQGRFGGCKGVWMLNPELPGRLIRNRRSMEKFEAPNLRGFEVAASSYLPIKTFLNRPMVKIFEDLGVPFEAFEHLQNQAVKAVEDARTSYCRAADLFLSHGLGTGFRVSSLLQKLNGLLGYDFDKNTTRFTDFLRSSIILGIGQCLRDLKHKARIPVMGPTLIGVCDIWGILEENEVFAQVDDGEGGPSTALEGNVIVTRSPAMHPGDIQVVKAVGPRPADCPLSKLTNLIVFSQKGTRPLADCLGGGDLDGDIYNVITDPSLMPKETVEPASYEPVEPKKLQGPSTMDDVADFFVDYILNDQSGRIGTLHLAIGDASPEGTFDEVCIRLAKLASRAVDFPKSGVPVTDQIPPSPVIKPDFLADHGGESGRDFYPSSNTLGRLFRAIPTEKFEPPPLENSHLIETRALSNALVAIMEKYSDLELKVPSSTELAQWKPTLEEFSIQLLMIAYSNSLSRRPESHLTEEEIFVGAIAKAGKFDNAQKKVVFRVQLQATEVAREFRNEIRKVDPALYSQGNGEEVEDDSDDDDVVISKPRTIERIRRSWVACWTARESMRSGEKLFGAKIAGCVGLELLLTLIQALERDKEQQPTLH